MKFSFTLLTGFFCLIFLPSLCRNAPTTVIASVLNPNTAIITVPVTVTDFTDVGRISLVLDYDPSVLSFISGKPDAVFNDFSINVSIPGQINIQWTDLYGITLPDSTHLVDLVFNYSGGTSTLTWHTAGNSCEYAKYDHGSYTVLNDYPKSSFYINGIVSDYSAPVTMAPVITNVFVGELDIPVKVNDFNNIGSFSLALEYDSSVLAYQNSYVANSTLLANGSWTVIQENTTTGKKNIHINWTKNINGVTLPDESNLITLKFNYPYPQQISNLSWKTEFCNYTDGNSIELTDTLSYVFYKNGIVTGNRSAPRTIISSVTAIEEHEVIVPVKVYNFNNIGAISLTLDYDTTVLTFRGVNATNIPSAWDFLSNEISGRIILGGYGDGFNLANNSELFNISFIYHGGSCALEWKDDYGIFCEYADGTTLDTLYDHPREKYYVNGCVIPAIKANNEVFLEGSYQTANHNMATTLNNIGKIPNNQPYNTPPWNYAGNEHVASIPSNITDWVLVELRTDSTASSKVATRAGLLTKNGIITDLDGASLLTIEGLFPGYYYVAIYHRNHMPIMSSESIAINSYSKLHDFSTGPDKVCHGIKGYKNIDTAIDRWGMLSGDPNNDNKILINDYTDFWVPNNELNNVYNIGDFNMDGNVNIDDYNDLWAPNFGIINSLP